MSDLSNISYKNVDDACIYHEVRPRQLLILIAVVCCFITFSATLYAGVIVRSLQSWSAWTAPLLAIVAIFSCLFIMPKNYMLGYLLSVLAFAIIWHISVMMSSVTIMTMASITCAVFILQFIDCVHSAVQRSGVKWQSLVQWQLVFLRIYFGLDMAGHFTEKFFAGYDSYVHVTEVFSTQYFIPFPAVFVIVSGLCELAIGIGICMGFVTRLAALGGAIYYLIAAILSTYFLLDVSSSRPDYCLQYFMLLAVFSLSFIFTGGGIFSVDGWLMRNHLIPAKIRFLFVPRNV